MAGELNPDNEAKYQRIKDACDHFLEEVRNALSYVEYPKWVNGVIVKGPEEEAKLRAESGQPTPAPEAEPRPAETRTRK